MLKLRHCILVILVIASSDVVSAADNVQQMTVTLSDTKATLLVDGQLPLLCMTAAMDATTELGYVGVTVSEVAADRYKLSPTGISFIANVDDNTVTFRSARSVPTKVVICFLRHLRSASIENVRFASIDSETEKRNGEPSDAPKDRASRIGNGESTAGPR